MDNFTNESILFFDNEAFGHLVAHQLIRLCLCLLALSLYLRGRLKPNLPPGPTQLPLIGNLNLLARNPDQPYKVITDLGHQYGPVMRFGFGGEDAIIISDYQILKEAFVDNADITSERPDIILRWEEEKGGQEGRHVQDFLWRDVHKSNEAILQKVGIRTAPFENRFGQDLELLLKALRLESGEFDPSDILTRCVTSITWHLNAGKRLDYNDPELGELMKLVFKNLYDMRTSILHTYFYVPEWLQRLFVRQVMVPVYHRLNAIMSLVISDHRLDASGDRNDVIGAMLDVQHRKPDSLFYSDQGMLRMLNSFMLGGVDSMQSVLRWLFLYFVHHPDVQQRCYDDVMEFVGDGRIPNASDYPNLKYVTATVYEVLRHGNIAPLGVPHSSKVDVQLGGYTIPKNTLIFSNQYAIHRDPKLWDRPDEFRPERWLAEDGSIMEKTGFIPFSIGPRHCPGEKLAKLQLVLLTAGILQQFRILPSSQFPVPPLEGVQVLSAGPRDFKVKLEER